MTKISLYVGGKREAIDAEEAETHVARFEKQADGKAVLKFDISCRSWSRESFAVVQAFMEKHAKTVRYLDLADIIASRETSEGLDITEAAAKTFEASDLLEVDLSDNAMGPRGLVRVESLFTNSNLQRLYLGNCGLSYESLEMLHASILADDGRIAKSLSALVLDRNMVGADGSKEVGKFLPHCKALSYFSFNGCRPLPEGTKYICDGLAGLAKEGNPMLRRLDLEDCAFSEEGAVDSLCKALKKSGQLQHINLNDAGLGVEGMAKVVEAFKTSRAKLTHLCVDANELEAEGARVLADFLTSQTDNLVCLHAALNEFGDEGTSILLEPFSACRNVLEELKLDENEIEEEGSKALLSASFPKLRLLSLVDNDDMKKKYIKKKYGNRVRFGTDDEDDDEEDDDEGDDDGMRDLVAQFAASTL